MSNKQELQQVCSALGFMCTDDMTEEQMMAKLQFYQANGGMKLDYYMNSDYDSDSVSDSEGYYAFGGDGWEDFDGISERKLKWILRKQKMKEGVKKVGQKIKKGVQSAATKVQEKVVQPTAEFVGAVGRAVKTGNLMELIKHLQSQIASTVTAITKAPICDIRTRNCDLNLLWQKKCVEGNPPEWADSLFCALGEGNPVASIIFRMRFVAPKEPNKHLMKTLIPIIEKTLRTTPSLDDGIRKAIMNYFETWNKKIDRGEPLSWSDLPALAMFGLHFDTVEDMIESSVNTMGMSFSDTKFSPGSSKPTRSVDLNKFAQRCQSDWQGTLFCALAQSKDSHLIARLIGKMQFAPASLYGMQENHFIKKGIDAVLEKVRAPDPKTGKQSWSMWAAEKGVNRQLSTVLSKLQNNELLSWADIATVFKVATMDVSGLVEGYLPSNLNPIGLDIAKR